MTKNSSNSQICNKDTLQTQMDRSFLRERFLKTITQLSGQDCKIKMYEHTEVSCKVKAFDPQMENVIVENLITPCPPTISKSVLRSTDIISMHFTIPNEN